MGCERDGFGAQRFRNTLVPVDESRPLELVGEVFELEPLVEETLDGFVRLGSASMRRACVATSSGVPRASVAAASSKA